MTDHHPHNNISSTIVTQRSSRQNNGRASHASISSLSSHKSGGSSGSGKMKARMSKKQSFTKNSLLGRARVSSFHTAPMIRSRVSSFHTAPMIRSPSLRHVAVIKSSIDFVPVRHHRSLVPSVNEEWDTIAEDLSRAPSTHTARTCLTKCTSNVDSPTKQTKRVAFATESELIGTTSYAALPIESVWYTSPTCNMFLENSLSMSRVVRRVMKYAATVDTSYKSSTGLVSAAALPEYLSSPQEVIGIENHLAGQQSARDSLKSHHKCACLEEQRHLDLDGRPLYRDILAVRLADYSNISAYMAKERSSYSLALLD